MTKRETYEFIKNVFESFKNVFESETEVTVSAEDKIVVVEFCEKEIAALDRKAEKAKETAAKKKVEGDKLTEAVSAVLTIEPQTISAITAAVAETFEDEVTNAKVQYRLNKLAKEGKAIASDVKVEATNGSRARTIKAYAIID